MSYQEYRPGRFNVLPPVIKNLLIINGIFFLTTLVLEERFHVNLVELLGLHYFFSEAFRPHQIITYLFMHGGFSHLLFNMFALWMFGNVLENVWGSKRFLIYYLVCGLGAALLHYTIHYFEIQPTMHALNEYLLNPSLEGFKELQTSGYIKIGKPESLVKLQPYIDAVNRNEAGGSAPALLEATVDFVMEYKKNFLNEPVVVGASGSVFGLLLAFGMLFPNSMIYMYFFFPIKAKYFVIIYGVIELVGAINPIGAEDNVAHYAHLGGMLFGFILIKIWKRTTPQQY
jgi:membrane associated rhomboid family serine protease